MTFESSAVSVEWNQNNFIMKRGSSILLIESDKVTQLRTMKEAEEFEDFFRTQALVNREARRVFQAWERKDGQLLNKIQKEMNS